MLIKRKSLVKLLESIKRRIIFEGLGEDIHNALISQVGLSKANELVNNLKNYTKKLRQLENQIRNSAEVEEDSRLSIVASLNIRAKNFEGAGLLKSIEAKGSRAIEELEKWIEDVDSFYKIPTMRTMKSYSSDHANASTIVKNLKNGQGEEYKVYFKLSPASSLRVARELGGSSMCTVSDKSCRNFNSYTKPDSEVSEKGVINITKVLVTFYPISDSLKEKALESKYEIHADQIDEIYELGDSDNRKSKIENFKRAIGIQSVLELGRIKPRKEKSILDYEMDPWESKELNLDLEGSDEVWSIDPAQVKFDEAGWYDDLMFDSVSTINGVINYLYGLRPQDVVSLLSPEDLQKILDLSEKRHLKKPLSKEDSLTPMEKWIDSFPGRKVTMLPPSTAGFPVDDVRPGFGSWSLSGVEIAGENDVFYKDLSFYNCTFSPDSKEVLVDLESCRLEGCSFIGVNSLFINGAKAKNCDFINIGKYHNSVGNSVQFAEASLENCKFQNCNFTSEARLRSTSLRNVSFNGCEFNFLKSIDHKNKSKIKNVEFKNCNFKKINFSSSALEDLVMSRFVGGSIESFSIVGLDLSGIEISGVKPLTFSNIANSKDRLMIDGVENSEDDLGFGWGF